jgi:hypothetical protein
MTTDAGRALIEAWRRDRLLKDEEAANVELIVLAIEAAAAQARDGELLAALRGIVAEADLYREDADTPECYLDSGPYCGKHSFLEMSPLIDAARALIEKSDG